MDMGQTATTVIVTAVIVPKQLRALNIEWWDVPARAEVAEVTHWFDNTILNTRSLFTMY